MSSDIKFWMPLGEIVKSKDKSGNEYMRVSGVASTYDEDTDGEFLDPNGFDTSFFQRYGHVNWNHNAAKDPDMIAGYPTKVAIDKRGMYVEVDLLDNKIGKSIYDLAQAYAARPNSGRGLGFSVEGKALERDTVNPKIVKKAQITGLAITHQPKNCNTFLDIMKSMAHNKELPENKETDDEDEDDNTTDKVVEKKSSKGSVKKADTETVKPATKEALDSDMKNLAGSENHDEPDGDEAGKIQKNDLLAAAGKTLKKDMTQDKKTDNKEISEAEIKKSLTTLLSDSKISKMVKSILKMDSTVEIEKAVPTVAVAAVVELDPISKAFATFGLPGINTFKKAQDSDELESQSDDSEEEDETGENDDVDTEKKDKTGYKIAKSSYVDIDLIKSFADELQLIRSENTEARNDNATFLKAQATITMGLYEKLENLTSLVNKMADQPNGRKAAIRPPVGMMEKSFGNELETTVQKSVGANQISMQDSAKVKGILGDLFDSGNQSNPLLIKGMTTYDTYRVLPQQLIDLIKKEVGVEIV